MPYTWPSGLIVSFIAVLLSREMKKYIYRAEISNRFELVSIEQAKAQGTIYMYMYLPKITWLPALVDSGAQ